MARPKKTVSFNKSNGSINLSVSDESIVEQKDGKISLQLHGRQIDEFMSAINLRNDHASVETPVITNAKQFIDLPEGQWMGLANSNYSTVKFDWITDIEQYMLFANAMYTGDEKTDIYVSMETFKRDSMMRRVIELMTQFSLDKITLQGSTAKIRAWYEAWMKQIKINNVLKWFFLEYYRSSNVTILKQKLPYKNTQKFDDYTFRNLSTSQINKIKESATSQDITIEAASIDFLRKDDAAKKIPYRYTVLDPRLVTNKIANGLEIGEVDYTPSSDIIEYLNKNAITKKSGLKGLDPKFIKSVKNGVTTVALDPSFASQFFRLKQPYERYATPLCSTALQHIQMKNKLRDMDLSIVDSVKNKILKVTIGDKDFPATPVQMKAISRTLKEKGKVLTILWNHTLQMEWIEPKFTDLNPDKYGNVNQDIREAFGITPVLLGDTQGQNYATAFVSMKGFIENLRDGIDSAMEFLKDEFYDIGNVMGFDSVPDPIITAINLTDENKVIQLKQSAAQMGVLSNQTVCEEMGYDWKIETERMKAEKVLREEGIVSVNSPNTKSKNDNVMSETQKLDNLNKNMTGQPVEKRGLVDNQNEGVPKTDKKSEVKNTKASIDNPSLYEIFKLRHIGEIIYNKLSDIMYGKGEKYTYQDIAHLMACFPRNALSMLDDDFSNIDIESLKTIAKPEYSHLLIEEIENAKAASGMKYFGRKKIANIVAEAWAIYFMKYVS